MSSALEIFKATARLVLDKSDFDKGISDAEKSGKSLADNLSGYMEKAKKIITGVLTVAAVKKVASSIWDLAKSTADFGDKIAKQSQALGFSIKGYQEWEYILGQSGASIDNLGMTIKTLNEAIAGNSAETAAGLSKLGLSAAQLSRMSSEEQFNAIVNAFQKMPAGVDKSRLAMQLLGRNAQQLMPLLNSAPGTVDDLRQRFHDLGLEMSEEEAHAAEGFGDALDDLSRTWDAIKRKFGSRLLPGFTSSMVTMANSLGRVSNAITDAFKTGDWSGVFSTVTNELKSLVPKAVSKATSIVKGLFENADEAVGLAVSILGGIASGIADSLPVLIEKLPGIVDTIWNGLKEPIKKLGNSIIDGLNSLFGTKIPHIDEIKFPTWDDVKTAAEAAWELIESGMKKVFIFIFGEDEDGGIKWPTPDEIWGKIKSGLETLWNGIKSFAKDILKFVFGETEDGGIAWPDANAIWAKIKDGFSALWDGIKESAKSILKFAFGEDEDGGITWPTAESIRGKIETGLSSLWEGIKSVAKNILKFTFGEDENGGIDWPTPSEAWEKIKGAFDTFWEGIRGFLKEAATWTLSLFGMPEEDQATIKSVFDSWWTAVSEWLKGWSSWVLSLFGFPTDKEVEDHFSAWWASIKDAIKTIANWALGKLNLPSISDIRQQIVDWWNDVVSGITLSIKALFDGVEEQPSTVHTSEGGEMHGGGGAHFAKGLNYVPYDGFRAVLHRGETILNQNQGREWRQGNNSFSPQILYSMVAEAVSSAVANIQINMDGKAVGNAVTQQVSRNIYQQQFGRRFATV